MSKSIIYIKTTPERINFEEATMVEGFELGYGIGHSIQTFIENSKDESIALQKLKQYVRDTPHISRIMIWDWSQIDESTHYVIFDLHWQYEIEILSFMHPHVMYRYSDGFEAVIDRYFEGANSNISRK